MNCIACKKVAYKPVRASCNHTFCRLCIFIRCINVEKCPQCARQLNLPRGLEYSEGAHRCAWAVDPKEFRARIKANRGARMHQAMRQWLYCMNAMLTPTGYICGKYGSSIQIGSQLIPYQVRFVDKYFEIIAWVDMSHDWLARYAHLSVYSVVYGSRTTLVAYCPVTNVVENLYLYLDDLRQMIATYQSGAEIVVKPRPGYINGSMEFRTGAATIFYFPAPDDDLEGSDISTCSSSNAVGNVSDPAKWVIANSSTTCAIITGGTTFRAGWTLIGSSVYAYVNVHGLYFDERTEGAIMRLVDMLKEKL